MINQETLAAAMAYANSVAGSGGGGGSKKVTARNVEYNDPWGDTWNVQEMLDYLEQNKQNKSLDTPIAIEGQYKYTVETALQGLVGSVADGKASVASAITAKGVQTASDATFATMANNISQISAGSTIHTVRDRGSIKKFVKKRWHEGNNRTFILYGTYIWTDGDHIYHSYDETHRVLNKATDTWEVKTWNGLTDFTGTYVWSDGTNIYYSFDSQQYVLNKATDTWEVKTWNGLSSFRANYIWSDGTNIYYSHGDVTQSGNHYILTKDTNTWSPITWQVDTSKFPNGANVDGDTIFAIGPFIFCTINGYSSSLGFYDAESEMWTYIPATNRPNYLDVSEIWSDGQNVYLTNVHRNSPTAPWQTLHKQLIIDSYTDNKPDRVKFIDAPRNMLPDLDKEAHGIDGSNIWTDGEYIYASVASSSTYYIKDLEQFVLECKYVKCR